MAECRSKTLESLPIFALIMVQVIFGFNYAASRSVLVGYDPLNWVAIRLCMAGVLMLVTSFFVVSKNERKVSGKFFALALLWGVVGQAGNNSFFMLGLKYTTIINSAILNTLSPIFTLLFAILAGVERFTFRRGLGFLLAICGAVVIRKFEDFSFSSDTFRGDVYTVLSCLTLALFFIGGRKFVRENSPFWTTAWMFLFGGVVMLGASAGPSFHLLPAQITAGLGVAAFYNIVLATMVTFFLYSWGLTKVNPSTVAIFIYFQPVIAVLNAWIGEGETPSMRVLISMAFIFAGVGVGIQKTPAAQNVSQSTGEDLEGAEK